VKFVTALYFDYYNKWIL